MGKGSKYSQCGAVFGHVAPLKSTVKKPGEWNTMKIRVVGNNVTTWLNGEQMISLDDDKIGAATGVIALQIHDGGGIKVNWRNLTITEY